MHALPSSSSPVLALRVQSSSRCNSSNNGQLLCTRPCAGSLRSAAIPYRKVNPRALTGRSACAFRIFAADAPVKTQKWVLQPIGDGDCSHLDEAVPLPGAIELEADAATVGRVPERADIVIPIATVSGLHARLERKGGTLFVTDLDSTNGTYINDRQLRPGAVTPVPPGSRLTFGDDHLAAFKFSIAEEPAA